LFYLETSGPIFEATITLTSFNFTTHLNDSDYVEFREMADHINKAVSNLNRLDLNLTPF